MYILVSKELAKIYWYYYGIGEDLSEEGDSSSVEEESESEEEVDGIEVEDKWESKEEGQGKGEEVMCESAEEFECKKDICGK